MMYFTYSGTFSYPIDQTLSNFYWIGTAPTFSVKTYSATSDGTSYHIPIEVTISVETTSIPAGYTTWSVLFFAETTTSIQGQVDLYLSNVSDLQPYSISIFLSSSHVKGGVWRNLGLNDSFYCYSLSTKPSLRNLIPTISINADYYVPAIGSVIWLKPAETTVHSFSLFMRGYMLRTDDANLYTSSWYKNIPLVNNNLLTYSGFPLLSIGEEYMFYMITSSGNNSTFRFRDLVAGVDIFTVSVPFSTYMSINEEIEVRLLYDGNQFYGTISTGAGDTTFSYVYPSFTFSDLLFIGNNISNYGTYSGHSAWNTVIMLYYLATGSVYETMSSLI